MSNSDPSRDLDHEASCLLDKALRLSYNADGSHDRQVAYAALISAYVQLATFLRREAAAERIKQEDST
jgi:hypothetical protein